VLRTPEIAAAQAVKEKARLPGISAAERENNEMEHKSEMYEKKQEQISASRKDGFFMDVSPADEMNTNSTPRAQ
jgi:hypothetical protein